ncbi:MAG: rod shape-determining protein MreD [Candidatus Pelagibacter sp.]|nr:MAG: rod shape-determining protein MreD [Pelagibacterales bacterium]
MTKLSKLNIFKQFLEKGPIILLFIATLNEFDFNYLELKYFSFNFPFILIYYWSLKRPGSLGYGLIFLSGLFNDAVVGLPIGVSSLSYLFICGFSSYLRNITLRPSKINDWFFFGFTILVVNSLMFAISNVFFNVQIIYSDVLVNILFTFLFYIIFSSLFEYYKNLVFGATNV